MTHEEWRDVVGWEGFYKVSSRGRVRRVGTPRPRPGTRQTRCVHLLVAEAFLGGPRDGHAWHVDHIDRNRANDRLSNLQWLPAHLNRAQGGDATRGRPNNKMRGSRHPRSVLHETYSPVIRSLAAQGFPQTQIAKLFGVSTRPIADAIHGRGWAQADVI